VKQQKKLGNGETDDEATPLSIADLSEERSGNSRVNIQVN
jgi:hypothetical protein